MNPSKPYGLSTLMIPAWLAPFINHNCDVCTPILRRLSLWIIWLMRAESALVQPVTPIVCKHIPVTVVTNIPRPILKPNIVKKVFWIFRIVSVATPPGTKKRVKAVTATTIDKAVEQ